MYTLDDYKNIAEEMVKADSDRDNKFSEIDAAHNVSWELPREWQGIEWIRAYPTTKPADLIDAGVRALSTKSPTLSIVPLLPNEETRANFNTIERGLSWNWYQMERKAATNPTKDIVESALKYGLVTAQLVYLPYQEKIIKEMGSSAQRKRAQSYGPFSIEVHNPRTVHVQFSDLMPERVLLVKRQPYHKVIDFWGKNADKLRKKLESKEKNAFTAMCDVYDFWDSQYRCVWVVPVTEGAEETLLEPQEHGLGFLPWSCRFSGTSLAQSSEEQCKSLIDAIIKGDIINTTNLFRSLMISLAMARAAEPTKVSTTPMGEGAEVDATEPLGQYKLRQGDTLTAVPAGEIGQSIQKIYDMLGGEMDQGTGMSLLMQNNAPAGMAFATYNAVIEAGMAAIDPFKKLSEKCITDVFGLMVAYLKDSGDALISYDGREKNMNESELPTLGTQEIVTAEMLPELEDFYATVKLTSYNPSRDMSTANTAVMLTQQMKLPVSRGMEMMDISDPETALAEWAKEQKMFAAVNMEIQNMQFDMELINQKKMARMQQELQAEQMAQQQAQMQPQGEIPPGVPGSQLPSGPQNPMLEQGFENTQGQGFNGAVGGMSPLAGAAQMTGFGLPQMEGRDYRGLRLPPEGREAEE